MFSAPPEERVWLHPEAQICMTHPLSITMNLYTFARFGCSPKPKSVVACSDSC